MLSVTSHPPTSTVVQQVAIRAVLSRLPLRAAALAVRYVLEEVEGRDVGVVAAVRPRGWCTGRVRRREVLRSLYIYVFLSRAIGARV